MNKFCVFCASSSQIDPVYLNASQRLGEILADNTITIVYGGGGIGSMGHLADGALAKNGKVIGVIPQFMVDLEWAHQEISELKIVKDMPERKRLMIEDTDAVIALPGGSGTFEELFETISLKRLGFYLNPIIIVNINGFYDTCVALLNRCIEDRFMDQRHRIIWSVVDRPEEVLAAVPNAPQWHVSSRKFAAI
jgi:uncharacterized protein (TIGR00730 family)